MPLSQRRTGWTACRHRTRSACPALPTRSGSCRLSFPRCCRTRRPGSRPGMPLLQSQPGGVCGPQLPPSALVQNGAEPTGAPAHAASTTTGMLNTCMPEPAVAGRVRAMARYLQVSSEIAGHVESGVLAPGDELPSIRDAATRYRTTGSTIGRAYRHLADAGVIEVADRRRARVAAGGGSAARQLLGGHPALRLA